MCMSWDAVSGWTQHLDLKVETIKDGDKLHILLLSSPITFKNETIMEGKAIWAYPFASHLSDSTRQLIIYKPHVGRQACTSQLYRAKPAFRAPKPSIKWPDKVLNDASGF